MNVYARAHVNIIMCTCIVVDLDMYINVHASPFIYSCYTFIYRVFRARMVYLKHVI